MAKRTRTTGPQLGVASGRVIGRETRTGPSGRQIGAPDSAGPRVGPSGRTIGRESRAPLRERVVAETRSMLRGVAQAGSPPDVRREEGEARLHRQRETDARVAGDHTTAEFHRTKAIYHQGNADAAAGRQRSLTPAVPAAPTPGRPSSQTQTGVHTAPRLTTPITGDAPLARPPAAEDARRASLAADRSGTAEAHLAAAAANRRAHAERRGAPGSDSAHLEAAEHHERQAANATARTLRRMPDPGGAQESAPGRVTSVGGQRAQYADRERNLSREANSATERANAQTRAGQRSIGADIEQDHQTREQGRSLVSRANRASADARTGAQHSAAAQAHREAAAHPATEPHVREDHQRKAAAHAEHAARAHGARPAGAHGHAPDAPHALQKGKKGGSFYVSNSGRKVYTKKS